MTIVLGRRPVLLLLLGVVNVIYGAALLVANNAGYINRWWTTARWWPAAQGEMLGIDIAWWGIVWIVVGAILMSGIFTRADRHLFAAQMLLTSVWAFGSLYWAFTTSSPGLWGQAAHYVGLSATVLLAAGWAEPPKIIEEPMEASGGPTMVLPADTHLRMEPPNEPG